MWAREYWIIFRGPGFPAVVWFGSKPPPPPTLPPTSFTTFRQQIFSLSLPVCRQLSLLTGEGSGRGRSQTIPPSDQVLSSMNHSILSELDPVSNGFDTHEVKTTNVSGKGPGFVLGYCYCRSIIVCINCTVYTRFCKEQLLPQHG